MAAIREKSAAAQTRFEAAAAVDRDPVHDGFVLLAQKREREVLTFGTHPRRARKLRLQRRETVIQRAEDLRREARGDEKPHWTGEQHTTCSGGLQPADGGLKAAATLDPLVRPKTPA